MRKSKFVILATVLVLITCAFNATTISMGNSPIEKIEIKNINKENVADSWGYMVVEATLEDNSKVVIPNTDIEWTVENQEVLFLDSIGRVYFADIGKTEITAKLKSDTSIQTTKEIKVVDWKTPTTLEETFIQADLAYPSTGLGEALFVIPSLQEGERIVVLDKDADEILHEGINSIFIVSGLKDNTTYNLELIIADDMKIIKTAEKEVKTPNRTPPLLKNYTFKNNTLSVEAEYKGEPEGDSHNVYFSFNDQPWTADNSISNLNLGDWVKVTLIDKEGNEFTKHIQIEEDLQINLVDLELSIGEGSSQKAFRFEELKVFAIYNDDTKEDVSDNVTIEIKEGYEDKVKVEEGAIVFVDEAKDYDEAVVVVKYQENGEVIEKYILLVNVPETERDNDETGNENGEENGNDNEGEDEGEDNNNEGENDNNDNDNEGDNNDEDEKLKLLHLENVTRGRRGTYEIERSKSFNLRDLTIAAIYKDAPRKDLDYEDLKVELLKQYDRYAYIEDDVLYFTDRADIDMKVVVRFSYTDNGETRTIDIPFRKIRDAHIRLADFTTKFPQYFVEQGKPFDFKNIDFYIYYTDGDKDVVSFNKDIIDYQIQYKYLNKIKINHYVPDISFIEHIKPGEEVIVDFIFEYKGETIRTSVRFVLRETPKQDKEEPPVLIFSDIKGHWAENDIKQLSIRNMVVGYKGNKYFPDRYVTRGEVAGFLARFLELEDSDNVPFTDVRQYDWYYQDIAKVYKAGIFMGYTDNTFKPDARITREELAVVLLRAYKYKYNVDDISINTPNFKDQDQISDWAQSSIRQAKGLRIIQGRPGNIFDPKANATRAEVSALIWRMEKTK